MAVFALYVVEPGPMGLSEVGFGLILTAGAVGSLAASTSVDRVEQALGRRLALITSSLLFPVAAAVPAVTAQAPAVFLGFAVSGAGIVVWNVITVSLRQRIVPDHLLGRVNSGYRLPAWGTMPLGAALGGVLGELMGLRGTFLVCALLGLGCLPLLLLNTTDATLGDAPTESDPTVVS
ncbi:MAG: MFS transporter [Acidimicrobiales bacterium]